MKDYVKKNFVSIAGYAWEKAKTDAKGDYYILYGNIGTMKFGSSNNYAESDIRKELNNGVFARKIIGELRDKLAPTTLDLMPLDGLKDYGKIGGDLIAIPTIDLYREFRENIHMYCSTFWLSTPASTSSGVGSYFVQRVYDGGFVGYVGCDGSGTVRPFIILKS